MPNGFGARSFARCHHAASLELLVIGLRVRAARRVPLFQVLQFDPQNGGLDRVEPPIVAAEKVLVFLLLPIIPEHFQAFGNLAVIGDYYAAIAVSSQIFSGIKTKSRGVPQRSN